MKIFITGGTGFIGKRVVSLLSKRGHNVTVLTRKNIQSAKKVNYLYGDITKPKTFREALNKHDVLIHLAAFRSNWGNKNTFLATNSYVVKNMFTKDTKIKSAVFISSVYVHGVLTKLPSDELSPLKAKEIYGKSKIILEEEIKNACSRFKIQYTILRPAIVYGPGDNETGMVVKLISMLQKNKLPIIGSGKNLVHLIYVDDLAKGIVDASLQKAKNNAYILAGEKPIQFIKLVELVARELLLDTNFKKYPRLPIYLLSFFIEAAYKSGYKVAPKYFSNEPPLLPTKVQTISNNWHYSISKARNELGFSPKIGYKEGIKKTVNWYLQKH